jgi:ParB-like chromosome segregation protein Spo0J
MSTIIQQIPLSRLAPHPDNPNVMSRANFARLVRHIERTGRYEPLVVRPHPKRTGNFQIINGCHRCEALRRLGRQVADAVVWDVSDDETATLLATLNRLGGRDVLDKKLTLLRRLAKRMPIRELAKLLPQTRGQLERLTARRLLPPVAKARTGEASVVPLVFFVDESQRCAIEEALSRVDKSPDTRPKAIQRAAGLAQIARDFQSRSGPPKENR